MTASRGTGTGSPAACTTPSSGSSRSVSLGASFLRPVGGRTALTLVPTAGDLLVMGGTSQRTWQHTVPKVASAGPRMSVTFRHATNDPVPAADG